MKILAIMGSPKGRGAGYRIVRSMELELEKRGDVEFEYLFLKDRELEPCRGCFLCVRKGEERCPISDERTHIEEEIDAADGVILVSPCYVYNMSWLMKNFTDRMCYTNHRPRFFGQKLVLVSNAGAGMQKTIEAMRHTLGPGPEVVYELPYLTPPWPLAEQVQAKQRRAVADAARALYRAVKRDEVRGGLPSSPSFSDYLRFRFFKKVSADVAEYLPADYEYYRDKAGYYYETRVSPVKRVAASVMLKVSAVTMKDLAPAQSPGRA
ncbi:MAG: flavodoxin family protein [Spirochaetia bacterium]